MFHDTQAFLVILYKIYLIFILKESIDHFILDDTVGIQEKNFLAEFTIVCHVLRSIIEVSVQFLLFLINNFAVGNCKFNFDLPDSFRIYGQGIFRQHRHVCKISRFENPLLILHEFRLC